MPARQHALSRWRGDARNLTEGRGPTCATSIIAVATLGVHQGDKILVTFEGSQASEALAAFQSLAEENLGEF